MPLRVLIIGGSGFVSGTLARTAVAHGHQVWALTRGQRHVPDGVTALTADREDRAAFEHAVASAATEWDLVVDCIGYAPAAAEQDIAVFSQRSQHLVFISTDFVYDPACRRFPQGEDAESYATSGYGGKKRLCERVLLEQDTASMEWTVVRPCHIYGPGSLLGCLPLHGRDERLIERLRAGEALQLVGGGRFLQQPIFAPDLAGLILSCAGNKGSCGQIFCTAGPEIIESRTYYEIIAGCLGVDLQVQELPVAQTLSQRPEMAPFLCHRIYDLRRLREAGLQVPQTSMADGLEAHVRSLTD
jgi:nucleoside-diphosphate-sugar epimerase